MGSSDTQSEQNLSLIENFIMTINDRNENGVSIFLDSKVTFEVFSIMDVKYVMMKGFEEIQNYLSYFMNNSDLEIKILDIYRGRSNYALHTLLKGTYWNLGGGVRINEPFEHEAMYFIQVSDNKISEIRILQDTFVLLRMLGRASLNSNDKNVLNHYLETLNKMGLLSKNNMSSLKNSGQA